VGAYSMRAAAISASFFRKLLIQRHLIWNFVIRDLRSRYVGSFMGVFWSIVHPLVLLISYTFIFSVIFQARLTLGKVDNFALFAFCGILPWLYFQDTVIRSCSSVVDHSHLIRKTLFPSEILPIAVAFSNLVTHLIGFAILLAVLIVLGLAGWNVLWLPVYLLLLVSFAIGLGWLLSALQVFLRDTVQILSVVMVFWFWFTPIFYETRNVPDPYRAVIQFNPLGHVVEGYRRLLLEDMPPEPYRILALVLFSLGSLALGGFVFRNVKREFVDVL
jgi:lipopolysaccharide transport system permease protein